MTVGIFFLCVVKNRVPFLLSSIFTLSNSVHVRRFSPHILPHISLSSSPESPSELSCHTGSFLPQLHFLLLLQPHSTHRQTGWLLYHKIQVCLPSVPQSLMHLHGLHTEIWCTLKSRKVCVLKKIWYLKLCVHVNPSSFALYIPNSVELSAHIWIPVTALTTPSHKCTNEKKQDGILLTWSEKGNKPWIPKTRGGTLPIVS